MLSRTLYILPTQTGTITSQEKQGPQTSHGELPRVSSILTTLDPNQRNISSRNDPNVYAAKCNNNPSTCSTNSFNRIATDPPFFNEDNHLIGTRTGDGSHSTNQQPNTSNRRASQSASTYPIRGRARTRILCSGYNVRLKPRKENKIRPLKTKWRSTKTPPTTLQINLYPSGRDRDQHEPQKKFMYTDYIQPLRNINKRTGKSVY